MAKSAFLISLNYNNAQKRAERLIDVSEDIRRYANQMKECSSRVNGEWDGDNSDRFVSKMYLISDNLYSIEKELRNAAETIKRVSSRTYNTEMQALEISRNRNYSGNGGGGGSW